VSSRELVSTEPRTAIWKSVLSAEKLTSTSPVQATLSSASRSPFRETIARRRTGLGSASKESIHAHRQKHWRTRAARDLAPRRPRADEAVLEPQIERSRLLRTGLAYFRGERRFLPARPTSVSLGPAPIPVHGTALGRLWEERQDGRGCSQTWKYHNAGTRARLVTLLSKTSGTQGTITTAVMPPPSRDDPLRGATGQRSDESLRDGRSGREGRENPRPWSRWHRGKS